MYYIRSDASNAVTYPSSSTTSTSNTRPRPTSKYQPPPRPLSLSSSPASSIPSLPPSSSSNTSNPFHLITPSSSRISLLSPPSSNKTRSTSYPFRPPISNPSCPPSPLRQRIPVKPSLALSVNLNPAAIFLTMTGLSRAHSPPRSMSPSRHDIIPRPSSRCESLLRDTLRRDEYKRSTSVARSRSGRRSRPRGNSFLGQLRQDEDADDDADTRSSTSSSLAYRRGSNDPFYISAPSAPRPFKGGFVGSPPEVDYFPSLSPSSPSPMPPTMHRTRTSPTVPLASSSNIGLEAPHHTRPKSHTVPQSPRASRQPLPGTSSTARRTPSVGPDTVDVPLNSRSAIVSPHEAVLRAKLESVLHRGASHVLETRLEERGNVEQAPAGHPRSPRQRNHVRSHSQIVVPGQRNYGERMSPTSPNTLAGNGLSSSGTDLARLHTTTPGYRTLIYNRDSDHSPSEPSEPMTPPPTPPFNARTASELCKRMEGYVSFASVKGLGEPPGLDMDDNDPVEEDTQGKWGRFWRVWPFGQQHSGGSLEQDTGGFPSGR